MLTHDNVDNVGNLDNVDNVDKVKNNQSHNQPATLGEPGKKVGRGDRPERAAVGGFLEQSCQVVLNKQT